MLSAGNASTADAYQQRDAHSVLGDTAGDQCANWHALLVKSNREHLSHELLNHKGFETFLPLHKSTRRAASGRKKMAEPVFKGYVFCRFMNHERSAILTVSGVSRVVSFGGKPAPVSAVEIEAVKQAWEAGLELTECDYLQPGERVRVVSGPLAGREAVVLTTGRRTRVKLSISAIQRSVLVELDSDCVELLSA